jgi:[citrate (pro-3S)-lyase] ligase
MKKVLPKYGVEFYEIPRKEVDGEVVSASRVRKLLETSDWREISNLVPYTTLKYLFSVVRSQN